MSRKSKRNRPAPSAAADSAVQATRSDPAATPASPRNDAGKIMAIVIAVTTLLIVITLGYKLVAGGGSAESKADAGRATALASMQAPSIGPVEAKVHIVEFMDPACETCALFFPHVKKIMADNPGKIRLSVRHIALHKNADAAVRVLEAARAQGKYFETLEALLASQDKWVENHRVMPERIQDAIAGVGLDLARLEVDMNGPDVAQRVQGDLADAKALAVTQTPEYFVNGRQMQEFGLEPLRNLVLGELRRAYP